MPDRSDVLALLERFYNVGLTPVISYNGSIPDADVEVRRGLRVQGQSSAPILEVRLTEAGQARLQATGKV